MEEDGRYAVNEESVAPTEDCIGAKLIPNGYTGSVLSSVGGKDWDSANYLRGLVYNFRGTPGPCRPIVYKLPKIVASRKFVVSCDLAIITNPGESKDASAPNYISGKIAEFISHTGGNVEDTHKTNA